LKLIEEEEDGTEVETIDDLDDFNDDNYDEEDEDDEDYECEEEERDLSDSRLLGMSEAVMVREALGYLQQSNGQLYQYVLAGLSSNEQTAL